MTYSVFAPAMSKLAVLWREVEAAEYPWADPWPGEQSSRWWTEADRKARLADTTYVAPSFLHVHEVLERPRRRALHTYGASARVGWRAVATDHPFTGLFRTNASGIVRLSLAKQHVPGDEDASFTPGVAVLFPVTFRNAVSLLLNVSIAGQGDDRNFFRGLLGEDGAPTGVFRNWLTPPEPGTDAAAAQQRFQDHLDVYGRPGRQDALMLPCHQLSGVEPRTGAVIVNPVVPEVVEWEFPDEVRSSWPEDRRAERAVRSLLYRSPAGADQMLPIDFRRILAMWKPPEHVPFARVYARASVTGVRHHVADVSLASGFVASAFADERLHFRHPFHGLA